MKSKITKISGLWQLVLALVLVLSSSSALLAKSGTADSNYYTTADKEFYLTADEIYFIRPGLNVEVVSVEIPADMQPLVTFSLKDPGGLPLDINGVYTPGPVDMRFMLTYIPQGEEQKVILTSGTRDIGGTFEALGDGMYTYKFATVLPDFYDADATHVLGAVGRRDLQEYELSRYVDNEVYNFVPSGAHAPQPRDVVRTETCNARCHDPLALHGGRYVELGICSECHNPTHPSGREYSLDVMVHKIHAAVNVDDHDFSGVEYPGILNDCENCHTGGTPTKNFPLVASPNPVPVCDFSGAGTTELTWDNPGAFEIHLNSPTGPKFVAASGAGSKETGKWVKDGTVFYLVDKASGQTRQRLPVNATVLGCVGNAPGTFRGVAGAQHTNWLDHPSRDVCGSCHYDVDFTTGENHPGGAFDDDSVCSICHKPDSGNEFDASVRGAHTVLFKSKQFPGVLVKILNVTNTSPGNKPTVTFSLGTKKGRIEPSSLDRLRFAIAGPNTDFSFYAQEEAKDAAVPFGNNWAYTFTAALPADASGSFSVGVESRAANVPINMGGTEPSLQRDPAENYTFAFAVTDEAATPRRTVVDDYNCESCHDNLALHGGNRHNPQYCVTCHRPDMLAEGTDQVPQSVHFKYMIHKIHASGELENGYGLPGRSGEVSFEVEYPGDLRNCEKCHVNNSYQLPLPEGLLATTTPRELWTPMQPIAASCVGCHDGTDAQAHMDAQTSFFGESCSVCHGAGAGFAVEKVHAR